LRLSYDKGNENGSPSRHDYFFDGVWPHPDRKLMECAHMGYVDGICVLVFNLMLDVVFCSLT
jgi:hypothetical protein